MTWPDAVVIGLIAAAAGFAIARLRKAKTVGGCGGCGRCGDRGGRGAKGGAGQGKT